jgi:hypothetical protein
MIQLDKSIVVSLKSRLTMRKSDHWHISFDEVVPPKSDNSQPGHSIIRDFVRPETAWPVRAHISS